MELVYGYKQTEVGLIPSDWEVFTFGDIVDYTKGYAFKSKDYRKDGVRIIRVSDTTFDSIKKENGIYIDEKNATNYKNWQLDENDLIFTTVGSKPPMYDSMVGKVIMVSKEFEGCFLNQNAVLIRAKKRTNGKQAILLSHFRMKRYLKHIELIYRGNANQASITLKELFEYQIPLPSNEAEQTAIATALSDMDELIAQTDKLIEKKKAIKQGVMQKLLKPKEGWVKKKLGEVAEIEKGEQINRSTLSIKGNYPVYNGGINPSGYTDEFNTSGDTIIISEGGNSCGFTNFIETDFWRGGHCYKINPTSILENKYLYYALKYEETNIMALRVGSGLPNIQRNRLFDFGVFFPSKEEQIKIMRILEDISNELEYYVNKLSKLQLLKQGMMQSLLTGKIRIYNHEQ